MVNDLKYPFGFILTNKKFRNKYSWNRKKVHKNWTLYYAKSNEYEEISKNKVKIIVLGYFFDISKVDPIVKTTFL
ncbi:hypothetical protein GCM10010978_21700 [Compostibacillus humi]|uniref:Uncharacterized protein n=1 Tax=Compostibacillus humi TaxID=1245525 RepID=A0A8J2TLI3_9BACI|nr:hypothetical protein [Compostibacillus humi]GFZ80207.1 hypothetical protein GCM10010978_21700 [Compostibacillus humi]